MSSEANMFYYETSYGGYSRSCETCGDYGETTITVEWNLDTKEVSLSGRSGCYNSFEAKGHQEIIDLLEQEIIHDRKAPKSELQAVINQVNSFYGADTTYLDAPEIEIQGSLTFYNGEVNCYFCDNTTADQNYYKVITANFVENKFEEVDTAFCYHKDISVTPKVLNRKML